MAKQTKIVETGPRRTKTTAAPVAPVSEREIMGAPDKFIPPAAPQISDDPKDGADPDPTPIRIGDFVVYRLGVKDVERIFAGRIATHARGATPCAGQEFPALVVKVNCDSSLNLRVMLDGEDDLWATQRIEAGATGCWMRREC